MLDFNAVYVKKKGAQTEGGGGGDKTVAFSHHILPALLEQVDISVKNAPH